MFQVTEPGSIAASFKSSQECRSDTGRAASTTYFYIVEVVDGAGTAIARAQATTPGGGTCTTVPAAVTNRFYRFLSAEFKFKSEWGVSRHAPRPRTQCAYCDSPTY